VILKKRTLARTHQGRPRRRRGVRRAHGANKAYRTTPLRALWQHAPYFHDGSAATLADVVTHYNQVRHLGLTSEQQRDLVEYLKSR
jgi:cytochrome c peroxidase